MSSQLQAQENVLYLFRQGWTMDASGQVYNRACACASASGPSCVSRARLSCASQWVRRWWGRVLMCVCITCVQLRQPLVKQTPTEGDNMKAGGYPFVNRDQNPGTGCAAVRLLVSRVRDRPVVRSGDFWGRGVLCLPRICLHSFPISKSKHRWRDTRKSGPTERHDQSHHI